MSVINSDVKKFTGRDMNLDGTVIKTFYFPILSYVLHALTVRSLALSAPLRLRLPLDSTHCAFTKRSILPLNVRSVFSYRSVR